MAITTKSTILTTAEAAEKLGMARDTVRKYIQRGLIKPFAMVGSSHLVTVEEIERYRRTRQPRGNPMLQKKQPRKRG